MSWLRSMHVSVDHQKEHSSRPRRAWRWRGSSRVRSSGAWRCLSALLSLWVSCSSLGQSAGS